MVIDGTDFYTIKSWVLSNSGGRREKVYHGHQYHGGQTVLLGIIAKGNNSQYGRN